MSMVRRFDRTDAPVGETTNPESQMPAAVALLGILLVIVAIPSA